VTLSLFEIAEIGHWIYLLFGLFRFVILSIAKKIVLECFPDKNIRGNIYWVWQNLTSQVLTGEMILKNVNSKN